MKYLKYIKERQKQTGYILYKVMFVFVMVFSLSSCTKEKADTIIATEMSESEMEVTFSENNGSKVWTEEEIKSKFSNQFNQNNHLEIIDYEVITDCAFERVGAVLLKDTDSGTAEVAFMDSEGYFQKLGISAELAVEPEFAYLGNGIVSFKLLTAEGKPYTCEVSFSKENNEIKYIVKDIFD